ncbi:unnamed protein product [Camellia sinensis]
MHTEVKGESRRLNSEVARTTPRPNGTGGHIARRTPKKNSPSETSSIFSESILDLQKQLTLLGGQSKKESNGTLTEKESITSMTPTDKIRSQLDDTIANKCPFCGDLMIREISLPFILPGEAYEAASWEIRPHNIGA